MHTRTPHTHIRKHTNIHTHKHPYTHTLSLALAFLSDLTVKLRVAGEQLLHDRVVRGEHSKHDRLEQCVLVGVEEALDGVVDVAWASAFTTNRVVSLVRAGMYVGKYVGR